MKLFTASKKLKFLDANQIIGEAMQIPAKSPSPLFLISTITLILPLSLIQLLCKISFSDIVPTLYPESIHEFVYSLSFFLLFLLSTSVILFTVASLYASKSDSFISTLFAIPRIFKHLLITFLYALLLKSATYYLILFIPMYVFDSLNVNERAQWWGAVGFLIIIAIIYFVVHLYVMALWYLASVMSVVEPNVILIAFQLANLYFAATWFIGKVFGYVIQSPDHFMVKLLLGLACLFWLVSVNLTSLLVQSVFFLACKSHHNQVVSKKVLCHHLCGYDLRDKSKITIG
ncbi:hypothetical protein MKW92_006744 [Papaver armeniacum]|nr:hypothetical protein MKW92_006744 [Papaver armeniacum]